MRRILTATNVLSEFGSRTLAMVSNPGAPGSEAERLAVRELPEATEVAEIGHAGGQAHALALAALPALGHRLHHLRDHLELLQQRVDLLGAGAAALCDPQPARSVDDRRL